MEKDIRLSGFPTRLYFRRKSGKYVRFSKKEYVISYLHVVKLTFNYESHNVINTQKLKEYSFLVFILIHRIKLIEKELQRIEGTV